MESAPRALDVMSWSRLADHSIMEIMTKMVMMMVMTMMVMMVMVMMMMRVADALRASGCNELVTLARPCPPGGVNRPKMVTITMMMRFIMMMVIDMMVIMAIGMV